MREFASRHEKKQLDVGCVELNFGYMASDLESETSLIRHSAQCLIAQIGFVTKAYSAALLNLDF